MSIPRLTCEQAAIVGAYTGFTCGPFTDLHEYAEKVLCRPIFSHEFGTEEMQVTLRAAAGTDFLSICARPLTAEDDKDGGVDAPLS